MANILHRLSIDAPPARVRDLIAAKEGIEQWWTARPLSGADTRGGEFRVYFGDSDRAAAAFEVIEQKPDEIVWRCIDGPAEWRDTRIRFDLRPSPTDGTTLLFGHEGWQQESEFMHGCSTKWAAYLMSLKAGAEGLGFGPYPAGEMSRWDWHPRPAAAVKASWRSDRMRRNRADYRVTLAKGASNDRLDASWAPSLSETSASASATWRRSFMCCVSLRRDGKTRVHVPPQHIIGSST
jgi:uncharacterized protein YndB with AHSA1/START domain